MHQAHGRPRQTPSGVLHGRGSKFGAPAGHEANKIESRWPTRLAPLRLALCRTAVVPSVIHRTRHAAQTFAAGLVLDPVSVSDTHVHRRNWSDGAMQDIRTGRRTLGLCHKISTQCGVSVGDQRPHGDLCQGVLRLRRRAQGEQRRGRSRSPANHLSAKGSTLQPGQQPQGRIKPAIA